MPIKIKVADKIGFCFGVKRAIRIAEETLKKSNGRPIYSLGALIHNPQVVGSLEKKGLRVSGDIKGIKNGVMIICSHGAPDNVVRDIKKKGLDIIDSTCPFVKKAQEIVKGLKDEGYNVAIVGDRKHPEVKALLSIAGTKKRSSKKIGIVSQTTQNRENYIKEISRLLRSGFQEARIFNTICSDTSRRQEIARRLLKECDIMIVVGGRNSANTRRLWQICIESGVDSYYIETEDELKVSYFRGKRCAGVVSGASTPDERVNAVVRKIRKLTECFKN